MSEETAWSRQEEQSAGKFRILLIFWIYRTFGKAVAKVLFFPAFLLIYPFCSRARSALREFYSVVGVKGRPFRHLLSFAMSAFDKTDACALCKDPPRFSVEGDDGWMKGGCFLLSTHLGCIEVLPAMRKGVVECREEVRGFSPKVHAFQQMGHDPMFTRMFARHVDPSLLTLHAVEDIGIETAVEMKDAISRGEVVLMAGDRLSAASQGDGGSRAARRRELVREFLGRTCPWPKGVFRFAKLMECPVYAIVCVKTGWNAYSVIARRLDPSDLPTGYVRFLEEQTRKHPFQWYQFYRFFTQFS